MIKYTQSPSPHPLLKRAYPQIRRDFGATVEPLTLHAPAPELLAAAWMATRETELVGSVPRAHKEAVAAAVSRLNQCPYCVDAHTMILDAMPENGKGKAIEHAQDDGIQDATMRRLLDWASATRTPADPRLQSPPFSVTDAPEIMGTAFVFHYINHMVTVFLGETPLPSSHKALKGLLKRMAGWYFSFAVRREKALGASLDLLPDAPLPDDFGWATAAPHIAGAFARWTAVIENAAERIIPIAVQDVLKTHLATWDGSSPGISRQWVVPLLAGLSDKEKNIARLAFLTAFAPYQVSEDTVAEFRNYHPEDEQLVQTTAWASFMVARQISSWWKI